ncbi:MAG: tetratricopeptide repeat protein [Rhodospirillaceae bacterium]
MGGIDEDALEAMLAEGIRHHEAGDGAGAAHCYGGILARVPDHAGALHRLGVLRGQEGDLGAALVALERADRLRPGQPDILRHLGIVQLAAGQADAAARSFRAALSLDPGDAETAYSLGITERRLGRLAQALPLLRAAAAVFGRLPGVQHELGLALEQAGAVAEALAAYHRVLALDPGHGEAAAALERLAPRLTPAAPAAGEVCLCIGTPCFGGNVTDHYTISLLGLQAACIRRGIRLSFCLLHGDALITRARNSVVAEFLREARTTHLLFIDADIGFSPDQVFRLLEAGRDMVGGAYPVKTLNWRRIGASLGRGDSGAPAAFNPAATFDYVAEVLEPGAPVPDDGFVRARYVGTGFLLVRRQVFEAMAARYPGIKYRRSHASADADVDPDRLYAFFDCMIDRETGLYLSEDFTFCQRWQEMGGEIWLDLHSRLSHVGRHVFAGDYAQAQPCPAPDQR